MAIQIPKVERIAPIAPERSSQLNAKAPNFAGNVAQKSKGIVDLVETGIDIYNKVDIANARTSAQEASNEYSEWYNEKMHGDGDTRGIKHLVGDPTEPYAKFDDESKEKYQEIIKKYTGSSGRTVREVKAAMGNRHTRLYNARLSTEGLQTARYRKQVLGDNLKIEQRLVAESAGDLPAMQKGLDAINQLMMGAADDDDLIERDATKDEISKGLHVKFMDTSDPSNVVPRFVIVDDVTKNNIKIAKSAALVDSVEVLIRTKEVDKAKNVLKQYKSIIDPVHHAKLVDRLDEELKDEKAFGELGKVLSKKLGEQQAYIDALPTKTAEQTELKMNVAAKYHAHRTRQTVAMNRLATRTYERLAYALQQKQESDTAFSEIESLKNFEGKDANGQTVNYKDMVKNITKKQREALDAMILSPENSDLKVKQEQWQLVADNGYVGLPRADFNLQTRKLNHKDKTDLHDQWKRVNSPAYKTADNALTKMLRIFDKRFKEELYESSTSKPDGPQDEDNRKLQLQMRDDLIKQHGDIPSNTSQKDLQIGVRNMFIDKIKRDQANDKGFFESMSDLPGRLLDNLLNRGKEVKRVAPVIKPFPRTKGVSSGRVQKKAPKLRSMTSGEFMRLPNTERDEIMRKWKAAHPGQKRPRDLGPVIEWWNKQ